MKHLRILILSLFLFEFCDGQTTTNDSSDYHKVIKEQAQVMGQLLLRKDFKSFSKFTYPKVVELMGGQAKMIEVLERGSKEMEAQGTDFLNVTFGEPSKVITNTNELQCTLPQIIEMKVPGGRLISNSTLIAISTDNGKSWYFVDTSGKDLQTMKQYLQNLSADLEIPKQEPPAFYKD